MKTTHRRSRVADLSDDLKGCPVVPANPAADYTNVNLPAHCFIFNERFPGGFAPRFGGSMQDWSVAFGLRGEPSGMLDGWHYDMSASFGRNSIDFFMHNTINPQLAHLQTAIPTSYKPGSYSEFDKVFNFDISRPFDLGLFSSALNFAFGLEYREEEFSATPVIRTPGKSKKAWPARVLASAPTAFPASAPRMPVRSIGAVTPAIWTWKPR